LIWTFSTHQVHLTVMKTFLLAITVLLYADKAAAGPLRRFEPRDLWECLFVPLIKADV
jgi:hypothetical protein